MIEVGQRAFNVHPIRSNVASIKIGLRDVVIVDGQIWRQVGGHFVIGNSAVQVPRGSFSLASIEISVRESRVQTNRAVVCRDGARDVVLIEALKPLLDVLLCGLTVLSRRTGSEG